MEPTPYNHALLGTRYVLRIFTPTALALLLTIELVWLGVTDDNLGALVILGVFSGYQAYLRFGKPPGYDEHQIRTLFAQKRIRPGQYRVKIPVSDSDEKI